MLETVMTVPADYSRLRHAGVSEHGIDFLHRMLITEPGLRATETECLHHPWLKSKAEPDSWDQDGMEMDPGNEGLLAIEEHEEVELDASQLSLNDKPPDSEIEDSDEEFLSDVDELPDTRESKRFKSQHEGEQSAVNYPCLPNLQGIQSRTESTQPPGNRLFGEIGASALRSSGVLGYDAHAALQMPMEGNRDDGASASDLAYSDESSVTEDILAQHFQYPRALPGPNFTGSAPSLFGAEALVGQLNMASPESGVSGPSASTSAAPTTPKTREPSPLSNEELRSKRPSQDVNDTTPKRAKSSHFEAASQPSVELTTHQSVSESRDAAKHKTHIGKKPKSPSKSRDGKISKDQASDPTEHKPTTRSSKKAANDKPTEQAKEKRSTEGAKDVAGVSTNHPHTAPTQDPIGQGSSSSSSSSNASASASTPKRFTPFTKPPPRLGNLTPMLGSIHTPTIKLEKRITTYGRDPGSDFQHKDGLDTRIPKCALDIIFWRPGIEAQLIENPELDWTAFDDLYAIVSTRTSQSVSVNGVVLRKGDGCWKFGKLHTGDIITIFDPVGKEGRELDFLRFKCEFLVGASKEGRKEGSFFKVEKEEEKYLKWQMRKSRESSVLSGASDGGNGGQAGSSAAASAATTPAVATTAAAP